MAPAAKKRKTLLQLLTILAETACVHWNVLKTNSAFLNCRPWTRCAALVWDSLEKHPLILFLPFLVKFTRKGSSCWVRTGGACAVSERSDRSICFWLKRALESSSFTRNQETNQSPLLCHTLHTAARNRAVPQRVVYTSFRNGKEHRVKQCIIWSGVDTCKQNRSRSPEWVQMLLLNLAEVKVVNRNYSLILTLIVTDRYTFSGLNLTCNKKVQGYHSIQLQFLCASFTTVDNKHITVILHNTSHNIFTRNDEKKKTLLLANLYLTNDSNEKL